MRIHQLPTTRSAQPIFHRLRRPLLLPYISLLCIHFQFPRPTTPTRRYSTTPPPGRLADKKVLITGASRGIGAAIASRFALEGAQCVLVGRDKARLEDVRRSLDGGRHSVRVGDVGSAEFWGLVRREEVCVSLFLSRVLGFFSWLRWG